MQQQPSQQSQTSSLHNQTEHSPIMTTPKRPSSSHSLQTTSQPSRVHPRSTPEQDVLSRRSSSAHKSIRIAAVQCKKETMNIKTMKECRICLEGEVEGRMIKPCQCAGSISYVHEKCIKEWIKRKHDPKNHKNKPTCEMCSTPFHYKYGRNRAMDYQHFCANYQKQRCGFRIFYALCSVLLFVIFAMIFIVSISNQTTELGLTIKNVLVKAQNMKVIYICMIFILITVLMFLVIRFIIEYAVKSEIVIVEVFGFLEGVKKKQIKVFPKDKPELDTAPAINAESTFS